MELKQVLSMTKGDGENTYLKASLFSQKFASMMVPLIDRVAQSLLQTHNLFPCKVLKIADLACSTGPNTFLMISTMLQGIANKCSELKIQTPEIQFYLNDLPSNDFNTLFKGLSVFRKKYDDQYSCYYAAIPGSFHGQLLPRNTLHVVHCCYGSHWLSRVPKIVTEDGLPLNRGKIYIYKTGPSEASKAYLSQFEEDFFLFLKSRSLELVPEGLMLLVLHGRELEDPTCRNSCYIREVLSEAMVELVRKGLIDEEKLDNFNVPYYVPWQEEVREVVQKEGSFTTEYLKTVPVEVGGTSVWSTPQQMMKNLRAISEPFISKQFGEDLIHELYEKAEEIHVANYDQGTELTHITSVVVVLRKKTI